ncbi:MAG TPA: FAD-dependent oxidoreductase [Trueperaceae bacterium]|nr:FAD-dependent oxidoreductase [Trueperaceae bacterium]
MGENVMYRYVVIGGGMTADAAAKAIRKADPDGSLLLVSDEPVAPYKRPPLSKGLWKGDDEVKLDLRTESAGAELRLGRRATDLDIAKRTVTLDDGHTVGFERLLLATGARARELPGIPTGGPVVAYRHVSDYHTARKRSGPGRVALIVGGGFIGSEMAAALTLAGTKVHMVFPEEEIGGGRFPAELARLVGDDYRDRGVSLHPRSKVASASVRGNVVEVDLEGGESLTADLVVLGIGAVPNDGLARDAGLKVDNGVWVDDHLRAAVADDGPRVDGELGVYAAGDVASFEFPGLGRRMRIEHEDNAYTMGAGAGRQMAASVLGAGAPEKPYDHLPFFYSDLFDDGYEAVGLLDPRLEVVTDWSETGKAGVFYFLDDGLVRGVLLWNTWGQVDEARDLILAGEKVTPAGLAGRLPK